MRHRPLPLGVEAEHLDSDMTEDFYRIKRLPPYVFAEVNRLKAQHRAEGMDIIDFGMGNPDMDTPQPYRRETDRDGPKAADASVFDVAGHSGPAPGASGVL